MTTVEKINKIMEVKGMTADEAADALGISRSSISSYLKGKGILSKYGVEKVDKYCEENGIECGE